MVTAKSRYDVGLRDSALLALLIGCGLRRSEAAAAVVGQWRDLRRGRYALCDIAGKHGRVRTVVAPEWVAERVNRWIAHRYGEPHYDVLATRKAAQLSEKPSDDLAGVGVLDLREVSRDLCPDGYTDSVRLGAKERPLITPIRGTIDSALSVSAIWKIVQAYAHELGFGPLAPHDLRRTYARLCREGGCPMDELQMALGHESVRTTERYVNQRLDVSRSAGDWIAL